MSGEVNAVNAVSTANTQLHYEVGEVFKKLVDIKDYPDMGGSPELIETTTLTQTKRRTNIKGLEDASDLTFTANYNLEDYTKISALDGEQSFKLMLGEDGADGIFSWTGEIAVYLSGAGVGDVREMILTITESTPITQA